MRKIILFGLVLICLCAFVSAKGRIGNVTFIGDDYTFLELKNCYLTTDASGNLDCSTNQTGTGGSSTFNGYTNSLSYWLPNLSSTKIGFNTTNLNETIENLIKIRNTTAAASGVTQAYVDAAVKTNISNLNNTLRIDLNYTAKDGNLSINAVTKVIQLDLWDIFGWGKYWFGLLNTTDRDRLDSRINNTNATIQLKLNINQSIPQEITDGIPRLREDRNITEEHQLVDKLYVDTAVSALGMRFYMNSTDSGVAGYYLTTMEDPISFTKVNSSLVDGQYIAGWISPANMTFTKMISGVYNWNIFLAKTSGTRTLRVYWTMVERKADNSEVVIATSANSDLLTAKKRERISLVLGDDYTVSANSRIVGKIYAVVGTSGSAPELTMYGGGVDDSHWEIPTNKEFLDTVYYPIDQFGDDLKANDIYNGTQVNNSARAYAYLANASMWTSVINKAIADNSSATYSYRNMFVADGSIKNVSSSANQTCNPATGQCALNISIPDTSNFPTKTNLATNLSSTNGTIKDWTNAKAIADNSSIKLWVTAMNNSLINYIFNTNVANNNSIKNYIGLANNSMQNYVFNKGVADNSSATYSYRNMFVAQGSIFNVTSSANQTCNPATGQCAINITVPRAENIAYTDTYNNFTKNMTVNGIFIGRVNSTHWRIGIE